MIHFTHLRRRKWFALADFVSISIAIFLGYYVRTKIPVPFFQGLLPEGSPQGFQNIWLVLGISGFLFMAVQYAFGVYDLWHSSSISNWLQRTLPANIVVAFTAFTYLYVTQNFAFPRSLVLAIALINYVLSSFWRVFYFSITEGDKSDVVLVGKWIDLKKLLLELEAPPFSNHVRVSAVFIPDHDSDIPPEKDRNFLVLPFSEFDRFSEKNPYTAVLLAPSDAFQQQAFQCVVTAARRGVNIYAVPTIYEILLGRLQHLRINDLPLLELRLNPPSHFSLLTKRIFDVIFASILSITFAVPMLLIALVVKLTSKGPAIYSQMRVGLLGKEFRIYKFRSMREDAEVNTGPVLSSKSDSRITRFGKIMRSTRLDELPQLWNILLGDMSFVGPRPERPSFVKDYESVIPGYKERHLVRPGVTGLAQVSGGYLTTSEIKLKYDLAYVANQNLIIDSQILFRTLKIVFTRVGQ